MRDLTEAGPERPIIVTRLIREYDNMYTGESLRKKRNNLVIKSLSYNSNLIYFGPDAGAKLGLIKLF
jgi:hypothetical protein